MYAPSVSVVEFYLYVVRGIHRYLYCSGTPDLSARIGDGAHSWL